MFNITNELTAELSRCSVWRNFCLGVNQSHSWLKPASTADPFDPGVNVYCIHSQKATYTDQQTDVPAWALCRTEDTRHHKPQEETQAVKAKPQENTTRHEGEIQRLFGELHTLSKSHTDQPCSQAQDDRPQSSASSSSSSSSKRSIRTNLVPMLSSKESAERQSSSSEDSLNLVSRKKVPPATSPPVRHITSQSLNLHLLCFLANNSIVLCFFLLSRSRHQLHLQTAWSLISWKGKCYWPTSCSRDWTLTSRGWERTTLEQPPSTCPLAQSLNPPTHLYRMLSEWKNGPRWTVVNFYICHTELNSREICIFFTCICTYKLSMAAWSGDFTQVFFQDGGETWFT